MERKKDNKKIVTKLIQEEKINDAMKIVEEEKQKRYIDALSEPNGFYDSRSPYWEKLTDKSKYAIFAREYRTLMQGEIPQQQVFAQEIALNMNSPLRFNYAFRKIMQYKLKEESFNNAEEHLKKAKQTKFGEIIENAPEVKKLNILLELTKEPNKN